jgi:beta-lactamase class C
LFRRYRVHSPFRFFAIFAFFCGYAFLSLLRLFAAIPPSGRLNSSPGHACSSMDRRTKIGLWRSIIIGSVFFVAWMSAAPGSVADDPQTKIKGIVDRAVQPVMLNFSIAGMTVGLTLSGKQYVFNYGVASRTTKKPVTNNTLFEVGSISKTFTATLASYAQGAGNLSLADKTSKYLPSQEKSKFGDVTLLNLGTHTSGGFPLQLPESIRNEDELMKYLEAWQPRYTPGTYRTYANPSIGMLGLITAKSMGADFVELMQEHVFSPLGLNNTYIDVPKAKMADYAVGYTEEGDATRAGADVLSAETYGVKTTASDMLRFIEANLNAGSANDPLEHAILDTHTAYFTAGVMTQDLIWEQYSYPVDLKALLEGNSPAMIFKATPVTEITPPSQPREDVWLNKTGSTNGFGAYVAFIPVKHFGIVIFANKSFPIDQRVTIAYQILTQLTSGSEEQIHHEDTKDTK